MNIEANSVTILRKRVVNNIPMFDDDETGKPQNEWIKLYDLYCVDVAPGMTARVYNLEHDENYSNQNNSFYVEFHFDSVYQSVKPPYDINEGDYVCCYQNGKKNQYRIVRVIPVSLIGDCCVYQLICNVNSPREQEQLLGCGKFSKLVEGDYDE